MNEFERPPQPEAPPVTQQTSTGLLDSILASQPLPQYETARPVGLPRDLHSVRRRLLEEADLAGPDFFYAWGTGKDAIEGPSQDLAHAAARCWGNCVIQPEPMSEDDSAWIFTARFIDLESGFTIARQFRQSKRWQVFGKHDAERKDDIRFQIGQSKAARNVILKALPSWLITQAMERAKDGVRRQIEKLIEGKGMAAAASLAVAAMVKAGVPEDRILRRFGVAKIEGLTVENLITIKGDLAAINGGREFADSLYPPAPEDPGKPAAGGRAAALAAKVRARAAEEAPPEPAAASPDSTPATE